MKDWTIGNTSSNENEKLRWVKVRYKNKILLICDRNTLEYMSWNDLYNAGYIEGKTITIDRSEEHTSELQSRQYLVCRLLLEKKNKNINRMLRRIVPSV